MGTYADMQTRIADELQRDDLTSEIQLAILQAIAFYQREVWYTSDKTSTTSTAQGTNLYTFPADTAWFRNCFITAFGTIYPLITRSWEYLEIEDSNTTSPTQGIPIEYAVFGTQVRLFPTPDGVYTLTYDYVSLIAAPVNGTDATFWTQDAEPIVRNKAKGILYAEVLHKPDMAEYCFKRADDENVALREQTALRRWTGKITPTRI